MYYIDPALYQNQYRLKSTRLEGWDYGMDGWYFVTICTKNHLCCLGKVKNAQVCLSTIGNIIKYEWLKTFKMRLRVILDTYIIMPNHIHGIIIINKHDYSCRKGVETHCNASLPNAAAPPLYDNKFGPQVDNLSSIIRGFKSAAKGVVNKRYPNNDFRWQSRFYDRVIRDKYELYEIRKYIKENPRQWRRDRNNPDG